MKKISSNMIPE